MKAIIMAGGKGTRLYDSANPSPKVLREACGRHLISYVFDSVDFIDKKDITIVVGFMAEAVMAAYPDRTFAKQGDDGYGTGYAVKCAVSQTDLGSYDGSVVILSGDVPCIKRSTVKAICDQHEASGNACTLLSCITEQKLPFGRVLRDGEGRITAIREQKDCSPEEKLIKELNVGLYVFDCKKLVKSLEKINSDNAANEYYLTDVPKILLEDGEKVGSYSTSDENELWGVNTKEDLKMVEEILRADRNRS